MRTTRRKQSFAGDGKLARLTDLADEALTSFAYLFFTPDERGGLALRTPESHLLSPLHGLLTSLQQALSGEEPHTSNCLLIRPANAVPDAVDYLNIIAEKTNGSPLFGIIAAETLEVLPPYFSSGDDAMELTKEKSAELRHLLAHAFRLAKSTSALLSGYLQLLAENVAEGSETSRGSLPRLNPRCALLSASPPPYPSGGSIPEIVAHLRGVAIKIDQFAISRTFRYIEGEFVPVRLAWIRPPGGFFGYRDARALFHDFFKTFAKGQQNLPLLISSLPGLGKTHLAVSHTLASEKLTLILPEPQDLEKPLEGLIRRLSSFKNRKFVLFFDDVDTRRVNWYYFRTNIGGSFSLPPHIAIVIASNFEFPANIASRGRGITFPLFDDIMCQEMVNDFLLAMGMKAPKSELVSCIAADYTEAYGQRVFEELSPRTLIRYLEQYDTDPEKRRKMLDLSHSEVITKPDSQLFQETNQRIIERLKNSP